MDNTFQIVIMGCSGGPLETNLSGYLVSPASKQEWVSFDAGSFLSGIQVALSKHNLPNSFDLKDHKAHLISHAHLDHIVGLVINAQVDGNKPILALKSTIDNLCDHVFNDKIWPAHGCERMLCLQTGQKTAIPNTSMFVESYILSHPGDYISTAFLVEYAGDYVLYFGDTGSDAIEKNKHLETIWERIAPLIQANKLKAIFLECSYSAEESEKVRFGHLDAKLLMYEMHRLSEISKCSLKGLNVIVTHQKSSEQAITDELLALNDLDIHFIFPSQGDQILV